MSGEHGGSGEENLIHNIIQEPRADTGTVIFSGSQYMTPEIHLSISILPASRQQDRTSCRAFHGHSWIGQYSIT